MMEHRRDEERQASSHQSFPAIPIVAGPNHGAICARRAVDFVSALAAPRLHRNSAAPTPSAAIPAPYPTNESVRALSASSSSRRTSALLDIGHRSLGQRASASPRAVRSEENTVPNPTDTAPMPSATYAGARDLPLSRATSDGGNPTSAGPPATAAGPPATAAASSTRVTDCFAPSATETSATLLAEDAVFATMWCFPRSIGRARPMIAEGAAVPSNREGDTPPRWRHGHPRAASGFVERGPPPP